MSIIAGIGIALVAGYVGNVKGRFDVVDQLLDGTATCSEEKVTFYVRNSVVNVFRRNKKEES